MSDIHHRSHFDRTPLLALIHGFVAWCNSDIFDLSFILEIWLEDLLACDVNLEEHGRVEHAYCRKFFDKWCLKGNNWDHMSQCWTKDASLTIASFRYGPLLSDWEIKLEEVEETYEIPGNIPGGWIEADQIQDEDKDQTSCREDPEVEDDSESKHGDQNRAQA